MAVRQPTLRGFPKKSPLGGYLYALRFSIGVIKVGMSVAPAVRLRAHYGYASGLGIEVTDHWVSVPHQRTKANEDRLISFCRATAERVNAREYFVGLDFAEVVRFAEALPFVPAQAGQAVRETTNDPRWQIARDALRDRILDGTYPPGGRLPSAVAICDQFGISPMTARRVLRELRADGLAEMQPGVGTFVAGPPQPPAGNS